MPMKNTIVLITILLSLVCIAQVSHSANTGSTHAMEGMMGGKYSGAPSMAVAGRMGLLFQELRNDMGIMFPGTIGNPAPLKKLGYKGFAKGDNIQMTRTGEHKWKIKHMKSGKVLTLKVVS